MSFDSTRRTGGTPVSSFSASLGVTDHPIMKRSCGLTELLGWRHGDVTCPGCLGRDQRIAALERRVAELEALVRDLNARLGANATNSGTPPSANPPGAPKPVTKTRTGKKPGGQPEHPARPKRRLPRSDSMKSSVRPQPLRPLPGAVAVAPRWTTPSGPGIRSRSCPSWACRSPNTRGTIVPAPAVADSTTPPSRSPKAHSVGPRLAATRAYLAGSDRDSIRGLEEITEDASTCV